MREVAVFEIGMSPVSEHWDKSLLELAGEPALEIFEKTGLNTVDSIFLGNMLGGAVNHQLHLGAYLADWLGAIHAEAVHIDCASASGAAAFRAAFLAVASGEVETALAVGVEKMTDSLPDEITAELAAAADSEYERDMGATFVSLAALLMRRYMETYGWKHEDFAGFPINSHTNAMNNPYAHFHLHLTPESYAKSPMASPPICVMDASPICDGAAAALLVPLDLVRGNNQVIPVAASSCASDTLSIHNRPDMLWLSAVEKSTRAAYSQAGLIPADIDLFELHDAFSIMSALALEAAGFAERGEGVRLAMDGSIRPDGSIPIATMGGLKARGHPVGATGLYQICEAVQQLRGVCGVNQVNNANIAMTQNIGGSGADVFTHIFRKQ